MDRTKRNVFPIIGENPAVSERMSEKILAEDKKNKKEYLRQRNLEELDSFDYTRWDASSPFVVSIMNALISTMGLTATKDEMQKIMGYAFGDVVLDKRTGNTGFTINYEDGSGNLFRTVAPVQSTYLENAANEASPLTVRSIDNSGGIEILFGNKARLNAQVKKVPQWYQKEYADSKGELFTGSRLVQWENNVLMIGVPNTQGYQVCAYLGKAENSCTFCGLEQGRYKPLTPEMLVDIVTEDLLQNAQNTQDKNVKTSITMTGGNDWKGNRGFEKYIPFVQALRKAFGYELPIQLEVSPPKEKAMLDWIVDQQLSFMSNLEVWNPADRKRIVPAKSQEIQRDEYFEVFSYLNQRGIDTYSVLITSLQPLQDLYEGTKALAAIGTSAIILPFRPNGGVFADYTPSTATDLLRATIGAKMIMESYDAGLDRKPKEYCSGCGGCGTDANLRDNSTALQQDRNYQFFVKNFGLDMLVK
ncbi:hypothetical protein HZA96_05090 [Candidatus Woesearchaeota archaeon]|nr:hypothetical protein [Candidatus Woesearchaeota archaeon]